MGFIDLILCPAAVIFAIIAVIRKSGKLNIFGILSYICCSLPAALSLYDIITRINKNDIAGILDIYPTMAAVYLVTIAVVTALNLYSAFRR